jgi:hypothetical protein
LHILEEMFFGSFNENAKITFLTNSFVYTQKSSPINGGDMESPVHSQTEAEKNLLTKPFIRCQNRGQTILLRLF